MADLASALIPGTVGIPEAKPVSTASSENSVDIGALTEAVLTYLPRMANTKVVLDSGALVGELSSGMNRQLGKAYL